MRSRLSLIVLIAVAATAALAVALVAVAGAEEDTDLPPMSASEVLSRMASGEQAPDAVSGDIAWTNRLLGDLPMFREEFDDAASPSPLLRDGSGRVWAQDDRVRLESQSGRGDHIVVADGREGSVWVYDGAENTARLFEVEGGTAARGDEVAPSPTALTPEGINGMLQAAARFMTVEVTGQGVVAGQDAYILTMRPAAEDTALGTIEAAVDGRTFVPLRVEVTARGADDPVLSFGFERVSYAAVDDSLFTFSPPEGAQVERETIDPDDFGHEKGADGERPSEQELRGQARRALLTLDQARELVDFDLRAAEGYEARAFRWAYVFDDGLPLDATGTPLFRGLLGAGAAPEGDGESPAEGAESRDDAARGPAAVLLYGEGFGAVALAQTATTPEIREQLRELPLVEPREVAGAQARVLLTPLGGVVVWEDDGVTLAAFGMVPGGDLLEFVETVR
jgi:outer membrane lipoprotein-sorting protein